MALSFTQEDLEALKQALVSNAKSVTIGDKRMDFKSTDEILKAIQLVQSALDSSSSSSPKVIKTTFSKGKS